MAGRPTLYRAEYVEKARKLCEFGATEVELADFFGVAVQTIRNWEKDHRPFADAIKLGKEAADERVTKSLYHKATGYTYDTVKIFQYEGTPVIVPYREHVPPDTTACIFWLKNRRPDLWRDKIDINGKHEHTHKLDAATAELLGRLSPEQIDALEGAFQVIEEHAGEAAERADARDAEGAAGKARALPSPR